MATLNVPIRIKRGDGIPTQLRQGELAFDQTTAKLYIGSGTEVNGFALNVVELTTPPTVLADLADISVSSGAADGDVLVYDGDTGEWVAQAITASSVAWDDVTSKPASFAPTAHTHGLTDSYVGEIAAAADQDYTIDLRVPFARVVTEFAIISDSGTCTAALKNGSNTIVGSVSVSSTIANKTGGDLDNTHKNLAVNDKLVLAISANASATRVQFCVKYTAVTGAIS